MIYRKSKAEDSWHVCRNCSKWPTEDYDENPINPETGQLCNECKSRLVQGKCLLIDVRG